MGNEGKIQFAGIIAHFVSESFFNIIMVLCYLRTDPTEGSERKKWVFAPE